MPDFPDTSACDLDRPIEQAISGGAGWITKNPPYWPTVSAVARPLVPSIGALGGDTLNSLADRAIGGQ